ncbi:MAG: rhodanese-like domain-containing protein, partial [Nitrospirae bacterium]|nr:rhodanese-like domain-containing protein [Nitrospirota bacterium]
MKRKGIITAVVAVAVAGLFLLGASAMAAEVVQKPKIAASCKQCHTPDEKMLWGTFAGIAGVAKTIQITVGPATWIVKYDSNTKLVGEEKWSKIPKEKEIAVAIIEKGGVLYAASVTVKPPSKIAPEKLIKVEDMAKLVSLGSEKGKFTLVDSRPAPKYNEGHIPGAISIYDAEFAMNIEKLPKDKDKLLIFYCAGSTCSLSPSSAGKAENLSYT